MLDGASKSLSFAVRGFSLDDDATERIVMQREALAEDTLRSELNWYLVNTAAHYEALGRQHFDTFGVQVRRDLDDEFRAFQEESLADLHRRFPGADIKDPSYAKDAFVASALEVLAKRGEPSDHDRVLRYVDYPNFQVRASALHALATVGRSEDAEHAVRLAMSSDGPSAWRLKAAQVALALSPPSAYQLLDSDDPSVAKLAVQALPADTEGTQALRGALCHREDTVRQAAVARLAATAERDELIGVLDDYPRQGRYFYNVVVWLDRLLYAPRPLQERYREELGIGQEELDEI
jgi:HEAT repeat protein